MAVEIEGHAGDYEHDVLRVTFQFSCRLGFPYAPPTQSVRPAEVLDKTNFVVCHARVEEPLPERSRTIPDRGSIELAVDGMIQHDPTGTSEPLVIQETIARHPGPTERIIHNDG